MLLILSEIFAPVIGGSAVWLGRIAESWPGDVRVLAAQVAGAHRDESRGRVTVRRLRLRFTSWSPDCLDSSLAYVSLLAETIRTVRAMRPRVLLCGRAIPEGIVARIVSALTGVPYVALVHGEEVTTCQLSGALRRLLRFAMQGARLVIANSTNTSRLAISAGAAPGQCVVIPPGVAVSDYSTVDHAAVEQIRQSASGKIVLSVGRLDVHKNHVGMVRAVANLIRDGSDVTYLIAGNGRHRSAIQAEASRLGIDGRVTLLGEVSDETLVNLYHAADVFALPGTVFNGGFEGFGIVFLEAAAAGKVCIAGDSGGSAEAVADGETGFVVDGRDIDRLTAVLRRVLEDDGLRIRMGQAGRRRVARDFDWPVVLGRLNQAVLKAVGAEAAP